MPQILSDFDPEHDVQDLCVKLLKTPLQFSEDDFEEIIKKGLTFKHLRTLVRKIYDLNENQLAETSNANEGSLGKMNKKSTEKRQAEFFKRVDNQKPDERYYKIYAEGDSWFQFPKFITDIIDWLGKHKDFLIYSDAYGGDWITNIIYEEQYITALSTFKPDYFLISGGGNDLVGGYRLAIMADKQSNYVPKYKKEEDIKDATLSAAEKQTLMKAQKHLNKEFYALLLVFRLQYTLMFRQLYNEKSKHNHLISITQGYDYAIPSPKNRFAFSSPLQPIVNSFLGTGKWLYTPLMIKQIFDAEAQRSVVFALIYEFNEMMRKFAEDDQFPHVFHIDNRGLAQDIDDWYDELHYKSGVYKKVAQAYDKVIREHQNLGSRVIRTRDLFN